MRKRLPIFYKTPYSKFSTIFFSYVDPIGDLITVSYTAGPDGYVETRNVQPGFVTIRQQSKSSAVAPAPVAPVRPAVVPVAAPNDSDLVAKIISQLTPFIQQTVSSSLSSSAQTVRQPAVAVAAPVAPRPVAPVQQAASSVQGVFGVAGQNNVRVETPNFNFNYDLQK